MSVRVCPISTFESADLLWHFVSTLRYCSPHKHRTFTFLQSELGTYRTREAI